MKLYIQAFTSCNRPELAHITAHDLPMKSDRLVVYSDVLAVIDVDLTKEQIYQAVEKAIADHKDQRIAALKAELEKEQAA